MVVEFEDLRRKLKASGYEAGANILGGLARTLYQEGLIPATLENEGVIFEEKVRTGDELFPVDGTRLRDIRRLLKMTQKDVAMITELSRGYISQIENGVSIPSFDAAQKIAQAYGMHVSELVVQVGEE